MSGKEPYKVTDHAFGGYIMATSNDVLNYLGDTPHQLKCIKCGRYFWTVEHIYDKSSNTKRTPFYTCENCGNSGFEVNGEWVKKVLDARLEAM